MEFGTSLALAGTVTDDRTMLFSIALQLMIEDGEEYRSQPLGVVSGLPDLRLFRFLAHHCGWQGLSVGLQREVDRSAEAQSSVKGE